MLLDYFDWKTRVFFVSLLLLVVYDYKETRKEMLEAILGFTTQDSKVNNASRCVDES